jgi:hypothetical protein
MMIRSMSTTIMTMIMARTAVSSLPELLLDDDAMRLGAMVGIVVGRWVVGWVGTNVGVRVVGADVGRAVGASVVGTGVGWSVNVQLFAAPARFQSS